MAASLETILNFIQDDSARDPYALERLLEGQPRKMQLQHLATYLERRGKPDWWGLEELKLEHAFEAMLGKPLSEYPRGVYLTYFSIDPELLSYMIDDLLDEDLTHSPEFAHYFPMHLMEGWLKDRLIEQHPQVEQRCFTLPDDEGFELYLSADELRAAQKLSYRGEGFAACNRVFLRAPGDGTLFEALYHMLGWDGRSSVERLETELSAQTLQRGFEERLAQIEDPKLAAFMSAFCDEDGVQGRHWVDLSKESGWHQLSLKPHEGELRPIVGIEDRAGGILSATVFLVNWSVWA